jgi:hypothetical protein
MHNFFKDKLRSKLDVIAKSKGVSPYEIGDIKYDKLEFGCYHIVWKSYPFKNSNLEIEWVYKVIALKKLNSCSYEVEFGKYFIDGKYFTSSEFIHFDIREYRELKLNELLNEIIKK